MKKCNKCCETKDLDQFWSDKSRGDGKQPYCISCVKQKSKAWRSNNKEKWSEYGKRYYEANKSHVMKKNAGWYAKNPEARKAKDQSRQKNHPEKIRAKTARRRAAKLMATPKWASKEKIDAIYYEADQIGMLVGEWYHVDHIVPLVSDVVCGLHCEQNLQIIPARENLSKSNLIWPCMP